MISLSPLIERLLKTPGAVDSVDYSITVNDLKYRWEWDPIRNDPRFQEIDRPRILQVGNHLNKDMMSRLIKP